MRHSAPSASRPHRSHRAAAVRPAGSATDQAPATDQASAAGGSRRAGASGRWWRQLPYVTVLCCLALVLLWMQRSEQHVRGGTLAVAGLLFATAMARLTLPERQAGMLASRRRLTDVAVLTALGAGLLVAGLLLPVQP